MRLILTVILCMGVVSPAVLADVLTLKNGDRITGQIVDTKGDKLVIKTEFLGEVTVDRAAVTEIRTEAPVVVTLANGRKVEGTVAASADKVTVQAAQGDPVTVERAELEALRIAANQAAFDREQVRLGNPPLWDFWVVDADFGLAFSRGNSRTSAYHTGAHLARVTGVDKIQLRFNQLYETQSTRPPVGATANRISGGARLDRNVNSRMFAFGTADFDYDEFQNLDLRSVLGGGLGYQILKNERHSWSAGAGGAWNREKFSDPLGLQGGFTRNTGEVLINQESTHQLSRVLTAFQRVSLFPNLSETGEYRMMADGGLNWAMNRWLRVTMKLQNNYLSFPPFGNRKNDLLFTTGIGFMFAQR